MNLSEVVVEAAIVPELKSVEKSGAIRELVDALGKAGGFVRRAGQVEEILSGLYKREELGSTGIGKGVAVPHTKQDSVNGVVGTIGLSKAGVDYQALDGRPVHVLFLFVSNPEAKEQHVRVLERISSLLRHEDLCRFLRQAKTQKEVIGLLREADERLGNEALRAGDGRSIG